MRAQIGLILFAITLVILIQLPNVGTAAVGPAPLLRDQGPEATPTPPLDVLPDTAPPPNESSAGETCAACDAATPAASSIVSRSSSWQSSPDLAGPANPQYTKYVVWEALNISGQFFVDPESILTTPECTYAYPCGGLPPNCTPVRKALVLGPYCTAAEAWANICSRISARWLSPIGSNCPWYIVIDGVLHNSSWNPFTTCPVIGGGVVIPTPPANCPPNPTVTPTATPPPRHPRRPPPPPRWPT